MSDRPQDHFISFGLELSSSRVNATDLTVSARECGILRPLASRVAELANRPIEQEKRTLWYRHNALEPTRPLIVCEPGDGWSEIITPDKLECEGELARKWEMTLRMETFLGAEMCDDGVIEPYFNVSHIYTESDWGMHETMVGGQDEDHTPGMHP